MPDTQLLRHEADDCEQIERLAGMFVTLSEYSE